MLHQRWRKDPPESPCRGRLQTTASCAGSMAGVASVAEKAHRQCVRCELRKTSESDPLMKCRNMYDDIETEGDQLSWDQPGGYLSTAQAVSGIKVA